MNAYCIPAENDLEEVSLLTCTATRSSAYESAGLHSHHTHKKAVRYGIYISSCIHTHACACMYVPMSMNQCICLCSYTVTMYLMYYVIMYLAMWAPMQIHD